MLIFFSYIGRNRVLQCYKNEKTLKNAVFIVVCGVTQFVTVRGYFL
nr:MAG TPA_asm: hypothetical protein [Caudoviricetes sp.]